ncbi:MAG: hypothetical protein OXE53_04750 [Deltaproteobacteria bacterium]|nr:hypothetical protein [Deltaproteobacteria bacterium]
MKSTIWLSYDLGVNGDYEGMYSWLDSHDARECGSSVAFLKYAHDGDLATALKEDIRAAVSLDKRSRIYVIHDHKGRYLFGRRKSAPWEGFGSNGDDEEDAGDVA